MKIFVIGDIHGAYRALIRVLKACNFNKEEDTLIVIGDVVDGWPETVQVIEELLTIKNLIIIMGNHDFWCYNWIKYGYTPEIWVRQGGLATINSYWFDYHDRRSDGELLNLQNKHQKEYFDKAHFYYIDENNNLYVHGGITQEIGNDSQDTYMWDRSLWTRAKSAKKIQLNLTKPFNKVFIGHTSMGVNSYPYKQGGNIINMDTGGGWEGALSIMNVETEEVWQSEQVKTLYPEVKGR